MMESLGSMRILFVCMGNICRSPTAEGVFQKILDKQSLGFSIYVDSAGTHAYHVGESPDPRACRAAEQRGIDISTQRARRITEDDFEVFDMVIAMSKITRCS